MHGVHLGAAEVLTFLGGIGLFLLGMRLMSEGLKVAAGGGLRAILAASTRSRLRGLLSGVVITALVQSSSAVVFATIGFVNAGLIQLSQSIGVIYGANLGTTLTSWVVALIGFNVDLQALALPVIALGVTLRVTAGSGRRQALGDAIAGLGVFFLGLDVLQTTFSGIGNPQMLAALTGLGLLGLAAFVAVGFGLTTLTQSSSAALAITLTAAAGGLIPAQAAAAMVIGANVGTTSTAVFAALGATANARRAASAHVVFNLVAGTASFVSLPLLLALAHTAAAGLSLGEQPAVVLALFHTFTKLLGIALLWPFTGLFVAWLERRFRDPEEERGRAQHLDHNVLATPTLALEAARMEVERSAEMARNLVAAAISGGRGRVQSWIESERAALEQLDTAINEFASRIERAQRDETISASLPHLMRVTQYHQDMAERASVIATIDASGEARVDDPQLAAEIDRLLAEAVQRISATGQTAEEWDADAVKKTTKAFERSYQAVKNRLLRAGAEGQIPVRQMVALLDRLSAARRALDQAAKSSLYLRKFRRSSRRLGAEKTGASG